MGGSVSDNEIAMLGRDAGAKYVCVVERTEIGGVSYVTTSMVSVQSKIAEFSDMAELPRGERVINVIERQINAMLGISSGEEQAGYESVSEPANQGKQPSSGASYLRVNGQTEASVSFGQAGDTKALTVSTDGGDYDVTFLPEWCSAKKYGTSFLLTCAPNYTSSERSDWFNVTSGNNTVRVRVVQSGSGESSSRSSSSSAAKARSRPAPAVAESPFDAAALYFSSGMTTVDSRDYGDKEYSRSSRFWWGGIEGFKSAETRNTFGMGFFAGGGTLGDDIWGGIFGIKAIELFWLAKGRLAVPMSLGFDWRPVFVDIEKQVAANFIDKMSNADKVSNEKIDMRKHFFDITPEVGLQIVIIRKISVYVGYAYNVSISTDWAARYKIPGKFYDKDSKGDSFKVPMEFAPLQDVKEHFMGVPGTLRLDLKIHTNN